MINYQSYQSKLSKNPYEKYKVLARYFYKDMSGKPFELTDTQAKIFHGIFDPAITRVVVKTPTQYGKTDTTSMALLSMLIDRREKVCIIAPKEEQASIIMKALIGHVFDNPLITAKLEVEEGDSLDRLKRERSKKHITFNNGSEVYILTANVRTLKDEGLSIMGFGATVVVVDESSLVPDKIFSKIFRMVGGNKAGKIIKLGNPFFKNHFHKSFLDKRYFVVDIDWRVAVAEGRYTLEYIEEARETMDEEDFLIMYETKFPDRTAENSLVSEDWYAQAVGKELAFKTNIKQAGIDIARFGSDKSVYKLRIGGQVVKTRTFSKMDTMELVGWLRELLDEDVPDIAAIDVIGVGAGVYDRLVELGYENVVAVNVGESPDKEFILQFINKRAQYFWNLRGFFQRGEISLEEYDNKEQEELEATGYSFVSDKKKKIDSKDTIKKKIGRSPDRADALMLCFAPVQLDKLSFEFV